MAVNIITSGFLLLVLVVGVQSAIKDLGEVCTDGTDTCVTPGLDLVCDTPTANANGHCKVKAGSACNNAGGLCVLGATCLSGTCTCQGSYTPAASGKCPPVPKGYGAACASATVATDCNLATANLNTATCGADNECQCAAGKGPAAAFDGKCAAIATQKVGTDCATTPATDCSPASPGTPTNLVCDTTLTPDTCVCDAGFFAKSVGGDCATGVGTIGKLCPGGTECTAGNDEVCNTASPKKCVCKTNYFGQAGGKCFPNKGTLTGGCSVDTDCSAVTNGKCVGSPKICKTKLTAVGDDCTSTTTTYCAEGLTCSSNKCKLADDYNGGVCSAEPGTAFTAGSCTSGTNTVCGAATGAAGICVCQQGYEGVAPKACAITANMFGASCTTGTAATKGTCGDVSLVCSTTTGGTCVCAAGYSGGSTGGVCYGDNKLDGSCTGSGTGTCTDPNTACSGLPLKCNCKTDYVKSFFTGKCVLRAGGSTDCTGLACVEGSTCTGTPPRCTCDTGKTDTGGSCLPSASLVLGGKCTITETANTEKGTCTDPNAICYKNGGLCVCNYLKGYTASNFEDTCHASDAMMITTSSLLITLAAVISQLFVR